MISSRNLDDLLPSVHAKATTLINACKAAGIELRITCTYRDFEEQSRLYAIGRTAAGHVVTNATAGHSWHNWRRAFDVVPMRGGECIWSDANLWTKIGALGRATGLEWAGDWKSFKEMPHFQFLDGHTLAEMLAAHPKGLA